MVNDLISIITPNYNSEKYIKDTIQSVINQTYSDWEWFIIDDGSSDSSLEKIRSFKDERIKLIELNENLGAARARNEGIKRASGRYITFIDSDDLWDSEFLEKSILFLQQNNEEIVYSSYRRVDENLQPLLKDFIAEDNITFKRLLRNCPMPMLTSIYDTKRIGKVLIPIDKSVSKREDYALWLTILQKIPHVRAIKETYATYRIRKDSFSRNKWSMAKGQFLVYYYFLKFPLYKSIYYTFLWAYNGFNKYRN